MKQLTIYKASAGSGKTFRLVLEYMKLLVENPNNYRHILAVTFTNKATAEMKERIMRDLHAVALKKNTGLINALVKETGFVEQKITENAGIALSNILHDYDRFSVSTIDSFFQRVLRSFARESGLYGAYEVELDQDAVLQEAIDRLLLSVEDDLELRNWLLDMSEEMLIDGKSWQVRELIATLGQELFKDDCQKFLVEQVSLELEREKLKNLREEIFKTKNWFATQCQQLGSKAIGLMEKHQIGLDDFPYKKASFASVFFKLRDFRGGAVIFGTRFTGAIDNIDNWSAKNSNKKHEIENLYNDGLNDLMHEITDFIDKNSKKYYTASEISKSLYALGVLSTLAVKMRETGQEANTLLISESNTLLKGIIGDNDAPFVYEKTGSYFHHFMIDEFQDTSVTQWENFKPLVINSLSQNNPCLVVGDVKQSIYRWRNSDWQLLDNELKKQVSTFGVNEINLDSNWRSCENIVAFNNAFFSAAGTLVQDMYNQKAENHQPILEKFSSTIANVFADVEQKSASGKENGYISCNFISEEKPDEYQQETLKQLIAAIESAQKKGYRAKDIAILVNKNKTGMLIANALLNHKKQSNYNFEVISDDSLFINTSPAVRMLVGLMRYLLSPNDKILQATLVHEYSRKLLPVLLKEGFAPPRFVLGTLQQELFNQNETEGHFFSKQVENDYFPFFSNTDFKNIVQNWGNRALNDLTEELIRQYSLDMVPGEQATIQAFKDVLTDFMRYEGGNLHKFIEWWDLFGNKVKVQSAGERDAIRIMTVHKSKGLEFPIVMLPFCDDDFEPKKGLTAKYLWCNATETDYQQFSILPVKYSDGLMNTQFVNEYFTETILSYIDRLNVLYVAFTRAEKGLYLFTKSETKHKANASSVLNEILRTNELKTGISEKKSDTLHEYGLLPSPEVSESKKANEINLSAKVNRKPPLSGALKLRAGFNDFLDEESKLYMAQINEGKNIHELLSHIESGSDIQKAITKMLIEGKIDQSKADTLTEMITRIIQNPKAATWFDNSYKVLNESTILSANFGLTRPDRVMIKGNNAVVVDYKASSTIRKEHKTQVENYATLVKQMGFDTVEGYVWYLNSNTILGIDEKFE